MEDDVRVSPRVVSYDEVVLSARHEFSRRGTVDMDDLARRLAISRATLYRVVSGRDRLIGDVLWSVYESTLAQALAQSSEIGIDRLVGAWQRVMQDVISWPPFGRFLAAEADAARRALFTPNGAVHARAVARWTELLEAAEATREVRLPYPAPDAAQLLVAIAEVVVYKDLFTGRQPDLPLAAAAQRALLLGPLREEQPRQEG